MSFRHLSIKSKVLLIALLGPVLIAALLGVLRARDIKTSAIENIEEKSKAIVLMAEATRNEMARKLDIGVIKPFSEIEPGRVIEAVPVVSAMQAAAVNADKAGYVFRVPKVNPRNPANTPTEIELELLKRLKDDNLDELTVVTDDEVRYLKPIRLTEDCLFCHGYPRGEKDPTGGTKEGWEEGQIHGAFEIISSLEEANAKVLKSQVNILLLTAGVLLLIAAGVWFLMQASVIKPLRTAQDFINTIATGDFSQQYGSTSEDEFGKMAKALEQMVANLRRMIVEISASSQTLEKASDSLESDASEYTASARNLSDRAISVAAAAEEMSTNMNTVAAATEQAATNISIVADSTRDMSATINEISENTGKTQTIAAKAVAQAQSASSRVDELGAAAERIGRVTETITEISEQTNLLALNATIEAARAGEAGKGFAVVANEIKELARQTAEATLEIKQQIDEIQDSTSNTVTEIQEISQVINEVNEIVVVVVAAVEEQNVTTNEIAENISQATQGIQEVTENVSQSSAVADEVASDINQVSGESTSIVERSNELKESAVRLKELSAGLKSIVNQFKLES